MPTLTTNFGLSKPLVNDPTDQDLWGSEVNTDLDNIDTLFLKTLNYTTSVKSVNFSITSPTTGSTTIGSSHVLFLCDATAGIVTGSLPAANTTGSGFTVLFKKTDNSSNAIMVTRGSTDTIDGATSLSLTQRYDWAILVSDGVSTWNVISNTAHAAASTGRLLAITLYSSPGTTTWNINASTTSMEVEVWGGGGAGEGGSNGGQSSFNSTMAGNGGNAGTTFLGGAGGAGSGGDINFTGGAGGNMNTSGFGGMGGSAPRGGGGGNNTGPGSGNAGQRPGGGGGTTSYPLGFGGAGGYSYKHYTTSLPTSANVVVGAGGAGGASGLAGGDGLVIIREYT